MPRSYDSIMLTAEERNLLVGHRGISKALKEKIKSVSPTNEQFFSFRENELKEICRLAEKAISDSESEKTIQVFFAMLDRISRQVFPEDAEEELGDWDEQDIDKFDQLPDEVKHQLFNVIQKHESPDAPEAIAAASEILFDYMLKNVRDRIGLPQERLSQLLEGKWNSPTSPLRLEWKLEPEELKHVVFLYMAARLAEYIFDNQGRIRLDKEGSISNPEMKKILPRLNLPPEVMEAYRALGKTIPEWRVLPLYKSRLAMQYAGLLMPLDNQLALTALGLRIFSKGESGRLLVKLFRSFFQNVDLSFLLPEHEGIEVFQDFIPLFLYILAQKFDEWVTLEDAMDLLAVEAIFQDELIEEPQDLYAILINCLFVPLREFGLLEMEENDFEVEKLTVRKTPLFDRFIRFEFPESNSESDSKVIPLPLR